LLAGSRAVATPSLKKQLQQKNMLCEPGSNVTMAPTATAGSFAWNKGSIPTAPVKYSAEPLVEGCEPIRLISISFVWL